MANGSGLTRVAGETVLAGANRAVDGRWEAAKRRASATPGHDTEARVKAVTDTFVRELGFLGGATGAAAAVPVTGTLAGLAASTAELGWFTVRLGDLILTIAAIHGHVFATVDERRSWVLSILAFGDGATTGFTRLGGDIGKLARAVLAKYGARRGAARLGRILPLGIGAVIGSVTNVVTVRTVARQADRFFRDLPPATT